MDGGVFVVVVRWLVPVGAGLGTVAVMVLGAGWVLHHSEGKQYPTHEANARLDVLQQDTLVSDFGKYLGLTPTVSRMQCRDTPHGRTAPDLKAVFQGSHPDLLPEKIEALGQAAGWEIVPVAQPGTPEGFTPPAGPLLVELRKSFGTWESEGTLAVDSSAVTLYLEASADGSCP